jgi:hypothetical protein
VKIAEDFPLAGPGCDGDIRLIAFITDPALIRKILLHLGEPLEPPPLAPARGPPTGWAELAQAHDDRDAIQASPYDLPVIDIRSLLRFGPRSDSKGVCAQPEKRPAIPLHQLLAKRREAPPSRQWSPNSRSPANRRPAIACDSAGDRPVLGCS